MFAGTRQLRHSPRQRGAAAILAMMYLVIFGSLAAAMAIVSQGNLRTADSHLKLTRSLSAAETGMMFISTHLTHAATQVTTRTGEINATNAPELWEQVADVMLDRLAYNAHNINEPYFVNNALHVGPIALGPGAPRFTAVIQPHPLPGENYSSNYYQRPPYSEQPTPVSDANKLDATWIRVRVAAEDGLAGASVTRSIQMDFRMDKKIRYAILSRSRVMIGRNVLIEGPVGSTFNETHLEHGHPIQMVSDFQGLTEELDADLDAFRDLLATNDINGDNRINLYHPTEVAGLIDPHLLDVNNDGYIDEYDFFLAHFDTPPYDKAVTALELGVHDDINRLQLFELIDRAGDPSRPGYDDGVIDNLDRYAKIRGHIKILADLEDWLNGAANGRYHDFIQGPIIPSRGQAPITFSAADAFVHEYDSTDFDVSGFRAMASNNMDEQVFQQLQGADPADPTAPRAGDQVFEPVPYGAAHPYDYYDRPIYENMTFVNVTISAGRNALFRNCRFIGATFVETNTDNAHANFNYAGMVHPDGALKFPNLAATVNGQSVTDTKTISNNLRFDNCTFEGSIITDAPTEFTHVRNKLQFTGRTRFIIDGSSELSDDQKRLFKRSTLLAPHYSIDLGSFVDAVSEDETVELSGTIVAGIIDMRGQVRVTGTVLTTFEPVSNQGPVIGETSPHFNTTLGYFQSLAGDMEAELPDEGVGVIHLRYDPSMALPDGILGPIEIRPIISTYFEGGA